MNTKRPVYLNLTKMKFPVMAIVSILHRISGVFIFLLLPLAFYLLHHSLESRMSFATLHAVVGYPLIRFLLWVLVSAVCFHLFAGIRHITMDFGFGEHLTSAKVSAFLVIFLGVIAAILAGVWLW